MTTPDASGNNRVLTLLFVGVLMAALDIAIVGPALPAIQSAFQVGDRAIAWVFTVYVLFNLVATPPMSKLSDTHGRRAAYVLSVSLFAVGSAVVAASSSLSVMLVGRAVQGFGAGGVIPVASAVIGDTFPPERRGRALGLIGAVFGVAFLVGPALAGVVLHFLSWPWLFLINLPIAAGVIAGSLRLLPATGARGGAPAFDWAGTLSLGALVACLAVGLNQVQADRVLASVASVRVWPFLLTAALLVPVFRWAEERAEDPVLRVEFLRSRQVRIASALAVGSGVGEVSVAFVPQLLVAAFGVTEARASFMLVPLVLAMAVGAPVFGRMVDRVGSRVVAVVGMGLFTAGMLAVGVLPVTVGLYYGAGTLVGLGLASLVGSTLRYIMLNEAPPGDRGAAQGALSVFLSVGLIAGSALVGAVAASLGGGVAGYKGAFLVVGVAGAALTLASLGLKGREAELATARAGGTGGGSAGAGGEHEPGDTGDAGAPTAGEPSGDESVRAG